MNIDEMVGKVKELSGSDTVMLSFSRGKDAWGCWCALRDKVDIQPFHYYAGPPHLTFIDEYLDYAERKIGKHIINVPAPMMYNLLAAETTSLQPPHRAIAQCIFGMLPISFEEIQELCIRDAGLPPTTYTAIGVRAADSARRALFFKTHGPITESLQKFYPVWDWKKDKLMSELRKHNVKLPIDYELFGRSFDGLYYAFLKPIKDKYPEDYKKILEYFPLIDMEVYRYEKRHEAGF